MKKNKKGSFKNRIKNFYTEPGKSVKSRIKEYEGNHKESNDREEDNQNLQNPEEEGDLS